MAKHFKNEPGIAKQNNGDFKNYTKCWICDNDYVDNDDKEIIVK